MVNKDQGEAEMKLNNQMKQIIFRACPVDDRERGDSGWQIAMYLITVVTDMKFADNQVFTFHN